MRETAQAPKVNYTLAVTASNGTTAKQKLASTDQQCTVRLVASVDMFINFGVGSAPTASTSTGMFIPAYAPEYIDLSSLANQGDLYVSGIVSSSTGTLYVSVMG